VAPNKFIQVSNSPINIRLVLKCRQCSRKLKLTCCKGVINLATVECAGCAGKGRWRIQDIDASTGTIWGDGCKIENHEEVEEAPSVLRVMGCVVCLKFASC
jgi:hypothetical protein